MSWETRQRSLSGFTSENLSRKYVVCGDLFVFQLYLTFSNDDESLVNTSHSMTKITKPMTNNLKYALFYI